MFQTEVAEEMKTHFVFNNISPPQNRAAYEIMWKHNHGRAQHATDENMAHALCILEN
jgi:hypothetical protein